MMSDTQIKRQPYGQRTLIVITAADREAVKEAYYWFWHYGIAGSSLESEALNWLADNSVQFVTTRAKYIKGATLARSFYLLDNHADLYKGAKGKRIKPDAQSYAEDAYDKLELTTGYRPPRGLYDYNGYDNGHGKAENLSDNDA